MIFEKEFPSLKVSQEGIMVKRTDVLTYCLDKQRVKEALYEVIRNCYDELEKEGYTHEDSVPSPDMIAERLEKELGL